MPSWLVEPKSTVGIASSEGATKQLSKTTNLSPRFWSAWWNIFWWVALLYFDDYRMSMSRKVDSDSSSGAVAAPKLTIHFSNPPYNVEHNWLEDLEWPTIRQYLVRRASQHERCSEASRIRLDLMENLTDPPRKSGRTSYTHYRKIIVSATVATTQYK